MGQLRLLASSHGEAQEWVAAINSNVKALNDARNGLPAPEWTRGTSAYSHGLQAPHHNHAGQPSASHAGALPHVSSLSTPGASASQLPAPRTASLSQAQVSSPAEMRPDNDSAPLASPDMSRPAAASSEQPPTPIAHATADAPAAPAAVVVATTPAATRHAPAPPLPPPHSVPVPASADAAGATDRHGRASRECAADSGSDAFGNAMCGPSDGGPPLSEGPCRAPSPPKPPPSGGPADSAASSASPTHTTADAHARSHLPNHDSSAVLSPATEGSALGEGAVPHSDLSTGARGPGAVRDWELRMDDKMLDKLGVGNGVEEAVEDVKETFTITLNQVLNPRSSIHQPVTLLREPAPSIFTSQTLCANPYTFAVSQLWLPKATGYVYITACVHLCVFEHLCIRVHIRICVLMCTLTYVHICTRVGDCACVCVCARARAVHTYTYTRCTYTPHTHTRVHACAHVWCTWTCIVHACVLVFVSFRLSPQGGEGYAPTCMRVCTCMWIIAGTSCCW